MTHKGTHQRGQPRSSDPSRHAQCSHERLCRRDTRFLFRQHDLFHQGVRDSLGQGELQRVEVLRDSRESIDQGLYKRVEKELGLDQPGDHEVVHQLQKWPSDFTSRKNNN